MSILIRPGRAVDDLGIHRPWWAATFLPATYCAWLLLSHLPVRFAQQSPLFQAIASGLDLPWIEPASRWLAGSAEVLAAVLLLFPASQLIGAVLTLLLMTATIAIHLAMPREIAPHAAELIRLLEAGIGWALAAAIIVLRREEIRSILGLLKRLEPHDNRHL